MWCALSVRGLTLCFSEVVRETGWSVGKECDESASSQLMT
jgi:hypothetical protein